MAYTTLLNMIIEDSGLTVKEIAERCKQSGVDITPAYISTLRNNKNNRAPSDKVSKALAKACEYKDEEALVIEAYLDSAPDIIRKFFDEIKKCIIPATMGMFENKFTTQEIKKIETVLSEIPMAQFVSEFANQETKYIKEKGSFNFKAISNDSVKITQEIKQAIGVPVSDDGMKPQICKGNSVQLEYKSIDEYKTGDIVCYTKFKSNKSILVRKIVMGESRKQVTMLPINSDFTPEIVNIDEIVIMGKVVRVTADIK